MCQKKMQKLRIRSYADIELLKKRVTSDMLALELLETNSYPGKEGIKIKSGFLTPTIRGAQPWATATWQRPCRVSPILSTGIQFTSTYLTHAS